MGPRGHRRARRLEFATGEGVVIAIIDTGVDLDHPDLVDNLVPGRDFVDGDDEPDDAHGHGTHVAGIAAAASNDIGIAGAAPDASIMPVRVLDAQGDGSDDSIAEAVLWAADNGADVINLSLGEGGFPNPAGTTHMTLDRCLRVSISKIATVGVEYVRTPSASRGIPRTCTSTIRLDRSTRC